MTVSSKTRARYGEKLKSKTVKSFRGTLYVAPLAIRVRCLAGSLAVPLVERFPSAGQCACALAWDTGRVAILRVFRSSWIDLRTQERGKFAAD